MVGERRSRLLTVAAAAGVALVLVLCYVLMWPGHPSAAKLDRARLACEREYSQRAGKPVVYSNEYASGSRRVQQVAFTAALPDGTTADWLCTVEFTSHGPAVDIESMITLDT
jgi:type II secretory pathway component PulM